MKMGKKFVSDYCRLVTGEKDPRNLRLLFSIDRIVILEFDISENVEVRPAKNFCDYLDKLNHFLTGLV
jgi:DNA repair/transcription protein MET18/MMS19